MITRTTKEIQDEIAKLEALKLRLRSRHSAFGDDHWACIDAQIEVLNKRMTEDDVLDTMDPDDEGADKARTAAQWLEGEEPLLADDPETWLSLCDK